MLDSTTIPALQQTLNFTETRQGVLAGNIANMDTPGYQVRDLSVDKFRAALREALDNRWRSRSMAEDSSVQVDLTHRSMAEVDEAATDILHHDGSNVSLEQQVAQVSKNQSLHNLAVNLMSHQFRLLNAAISERV